MVLLTVTEKGSLRLLFVLLLLLTLLPACQSQPPATTPPATALSHAVPILPLPTVVPATSTPIPAAVPATATVASTPTETASPLPSDTPTPASTPTPDPYVGLTIADLKAREYGGGELQSVQTIHVTDAFTRTLVSYPSDGLSIYGFMNVPFVQGPLPVALVLHGYIPPENYGTIAYTTRYADALARAGYLVIHPNYRNHPPSDRTEAFEGGRETHDFRVGYAVDVLNLLAIIQEQAGRPGPLQKADPQQLHLLGHSMGGGIALRVITVNPLVNAAVLYGSMSGDEYQNYERILLWSNGETGEEELATAPDDMERIAPIHYLEEIEAAVSIHHGELDDVVPPPWSTDLCQRLLALEKTVECFSYPDQYHTFQGSDDQLFMQRVVDFFDSY